jgi:hypothetical protein
VAEALRRRGHDTTVPDLVATATTGDPVAFARAAASVVDSDEDVVVVGHSAAGAILPAVAGLRPETRLIFVDATLPPCDGPATAGGQFLDALRGIATDGLLPAWSQWWGEGVLQYLVHDEARRKVIEQELPRLPLMFFETPISLPADWCAGRGGFLLLSEFYRADATAAAALGWPVIERPGGHLDIANEEDDIAEMLEELGLQA